MESKISPAPTMSSTSSADPARSSRAQPQDPFCDGTFCSQFDRELFIESKEGSTRPQAPFPNSTFTGMCDVKDRPVFIGPRGGTYTMTAKGQRVYHDPSTLAYSLSPASPAPSTDKKITSSASSDELASSDSTRTAGPLKYAKFATFAAPEYPPLKLELGDELTSVTVCYETFGELTPEKDNAVLILHALSGDSHVARHNEQDDPGWWDCLVGPGMAVDTNKFFVICPNALGGCRGTTGPSSINPKTGKCFASDFPTITISDIVASQKLLIDSLGIKKLLAVLGGSMGGHQAMMWATKHPDMMCAAVLLATSPRLSIQSLAFDVVGRNAILRDPNFNHGDYYDKPPGPHVGLALARSLGHITYLSPQAMQAKFQLDRLQPRDVPTAFEKKFSIGSYLAYQGDKFVERFDANSYITLSMALDLFSLGDTPEQVKQSLSKAKCKWLILAFHSDWLFPPSQAEEIVNALISLGQTVTYSTIQSSCGHDAFLLVDDLKMYGGMCEGFLRHVHASNLAAKALPPTSPTTTAKDSGLVCAPDDDIYVHEPTSIFHSRRLDYDRIVDLIPAGESVLDLGCGQGGLLSRLRCRGHKNCMGVEWDEAPLLTCAQRGLVVVQADVNKGLQSFVAKQFDFVVLSHTLQTVMNVQGLLSDMLRVGRHCIVSFPNYGYKRIRQMLQEQGRAPVSEGLLRFSWYNTPNIRFLTIMDFEEYCTEKKINVHHRIALNTQEKREVSPPEDINLEADMAIFVISESEK